MPTRLIQDYAMLTPRTLPTDATIWQASALMRQVHVRHIPVTRDLVVVGVVGRDAIEQAVATSDASVATLLESVMEPVLMFPPDAPVAVVASRVLDEGYVAVVIDDGELRIFTPDDARRALLSNGRRRLVEPWPPLN